MFVCDKLGAEDVEENGRHIPACIHYALGKRLVESRTEFRATSLFVENARQIVPAVRGSDSLVENCFRVFNESFTVTAVIGELKVSGRKDVHQFEQFAFIPELLFPLFVIKHLKLPSQPLSEFSVA